MSKNSVILYFIGLLGIVSLSSCMDDEDFSSSRADLLTFSTDTVRLDTTFSNVPTPTRTMWVSTVLEKVSDVAISVWKVVIRKVSE